MAEPPSPTIALLETLPKPQYRKSAAWPTGTPQPFSQQIADHFCELLSTCEYSLPQLLRDYPELPPYNSLDNWRRRKPAFNAAWKVAQERRADFLAERCADLAFNAQPKTAHVVRVKFDVYRWLCSRFNPAIYGDKPQQQQQTTVNVGVSISPDRLADIRAKLVDSRNAFLPKSKPARLNESNDSAASIPKKHARNVLTLGNGNTEPGSTTAQPGTGT